MLRTIWLLSLVCLLASPAVVASAQAPGAPSSQEIDPIDIPPEHDPLAHAWDRPEQRGGFYLRGAVGLGFHSTHFGPAPWDDDDGELEASGFGTGFDLDLGGLLAPWVALHLNAHAGLLWSGELEREFGVYDDPSARVAAYGAGPAATFFVPHNFYFAAAFGVGIAHTKYEGYNRTTNPGFFMSLAAGHDLYTSRHLAFGLQMRVVYMLLGAEQEEDEARVREFLFGVSVSYDSI